jgi:hypothetical protein
LCPARPIKGFDRKRHLRSVPPRRADLRVLLRAEVYGRSRGRIGLGTSAVKGRGRLISLFQAHTLETTMHEDMQRDLARQAAP